MIHDGHVRVARARETERGGRLRTTADAVDHHRSMFGFLVLSAPPTKVPSGWRRRSPAQTFSSAFQPLGEESSEAGVSAERRAGEHEGGEEPAPGTVHPRSGPAHEGPGQRSGVM